MTKIISFFNNKGGVSKTTSVYHLGWKLAQKDKKVVLIDLDPQCNLTGLCLNENSEGDAFARYQNQEIDNIYKSLTPAMKSTGERIKTPKLFEISGQENLLLLPGNVEMANVETQLATSLSVGTSMPAILNVPGSFKELYKLISKEYSPDYILLDMSPSFGAINQVNLLSSDYFICPTMPDVFSVMAIESLATTLPKWKSWAQKVEAFNSFSDEGIIYKFTPAEPKLLGLIIQRYRVRKGMPAKAFERYFNEISEAVSKKLIPALAKSDMLLPDEKYDVEYSQEDTSSNKYTLIEISDFNTLIAKSQQLGKPVFALKVEDLDFQGNVANTQTGNIDLFNDIFNKFADKVISLTS